MSLGGAERESRGGTGAPKPRPVAAGRPPRGRARCGRSAGERCVPVRRPAPVCEARAARAPVAVPARAGGPPPCNERSRISRLTVVTRRVSTLSCYKHDRIYSWYARQHPQHTLLTDMSHVGQRHVSDRDAYTEINRAPHTRARTDPAHNLCYRSSPSDTPPRPPRVHTATLMPGHRHHIPRAPPTCHGTCTASRAYGPTRSLAHSLRPPGAAAAGDMPPPPLCAPQKPRAARFAASCRAFNSAFLRAASRAASALASPKVY